MATNVQNTDDEFAQEMLGEFLDESDGLLRLLGEHLLKLDEFAKSPQDTGGADMLLPTLNEMFRGAHSLKGLSAMLRLTEINRLTHNVESVFDAARNFRLDLTSANIDLIFRAVDHIEGLIEVLRDHSAKAPNCDSIIAEIEQVLDSAGKRPESISTADIARELSERESPVEQTATRTVRMPDSEPEQVVKTADLLAGVVDDSDIPAKYLAVFIDETELTAEELSEKLLTQVDAKGLESLLVSCHRIKGSAASIGLNRIARLAHFMEDLLQDLRRDNQCPSLTMCDALLACIDAIRLYATSARTGIIEDTLVAAGRKLRAITIINEQPESQITAIPPASSPASVGHDLFQTALRAAPENAQGFVGSVNFEAGLPLAEMKARLLLEKLEPLGKLFYCSPAEHELDTQNELTCLTFGIATSASFDAVQRELRVTGVTTMNVMPFGTPKADVTVDEASSGAKCEELLSQVGSKGTKVTEPAEIRETNTSGSTTAVSPKAKPTETLRVDIERLDQLMNLAGQLVINQARFNQIGNKLKGLSSLKAVTQSVANVRGSALRLSDDLQRCSSAATAITPIDSVSDQVLKIAQELEHLQGELDEVAQLRLLVNDLSEAVHQLGRVSDEIQTNVMDTRMVPIGPLFARFKRVARDLTRDTNKEIDLVIHGENTELDKRMIDELGDPLIHLVRNSADHGIENHDQRLAAGKPRAGKITLNAYHRGNRIVIQVTDDGRGLDADRIRAKALARGMINDAEAERMTDQQLHQLIWQPGFSTAERITEVSGRGMGMDIVWSKIEQLNGTIELNSVRGQGTTFTIKLPLTMAILPSLLVQIDGDVFAVPVESVVEIIQVTDDQIMSVCGHKTVRVRGRVVPVIELKKIFAWNQSPRASSTSEPRKNTLVIVGSECQELGLTVDDLLGEHDIVIKSLEENFRSVQGIAGASILGDGRVSLILDVSTILEMTRRPSPLSDSLAAVPHDSATLVHA